MGLEDKDKYFDVLLKIDSKSDTFESSLPIAVSVAAYARMYMNKFITNNKYTIYYTDSIIVNKPLDDNLVVPELGQFKLEQEIQKSIFIAPKLYYL